MPPVFKTIINISVWLLFIKGVLIVMVTVYTVGRAFMAGEATPMAGVAACAAGSKPDRARILNVARSKRMATAQRGRQQEGPVQRTPPARISDVRDVDKSRVLSEKWS